jgi:hypothetical protein
MYGIVDFERIKAPDFEGIMMANTVDNWEEADRSVMFPEYAVSIDNF